MDLNEWIESNSLQAKIIDNNKGCVIPGFGTFLIVSHKNGKLFDDQFNVLLDDIEYKLFSKYDYLLFSFGQRWYYSPKEQIELNIFKYIGAANLEIPCSSFIGVHGGYELLNGSRLYSDWCKKAKFLGISKLGIAEKNTLAGAFAFQQACKDNDIKPIFGQTTTVARNDKGEGQYDIKLYVVNETGWGNLLQINKHQNVINNGFIVEKDLFNYKHGLVCVIDTTFDYSKIAKFHKVFQDLYFQFDPIEWESDEHDKMHLLKLKEYIENYSDTVEPILINDAYYLDKEDAVIKPLLNTIGHVKFQHRSLDQYFKSVDQVYIDFCKLFKEGDERLYSLIERAITNLEQVTDFCNFSIQTGRYLPEYKMTVQEKKQHPTSTDLFLSLIEKNFQTKIVESNLDVDRYWERVVKEIEVIMEGGFVDYFLILWDIMRFCKDRGILTGTGRGSAGGSLIAMLLDITKIDPIKYNLLFERFLNEARIKESSPDIDSDIMGTRRDEVKHYLEERYGKDNVCSIGTYSTLKIKAALKDIGRVKGIPPVTANYISAMLDSAEASWSDIFKEACEKPQLKKFLQDNFEVINAVPLCMNQPKAASIHAAGFIITPDNKDGNPMTIDKWIPVKLMDGMLVSEWEGPQLEKFGLLKEDLLGLKQLDKFDQIFKLVKENKGIDIDLEKVPLDDQQVYYLFKRGYNQDLFHFGSMGLTQYSREVQPDNIDELIAMIALYRPGAMDSGAHKKYVQIKFGRKEADYHWGTKEITKETFGLLVYQEQLIKLVQEIGGFSLAESDIIRRAIGKKKMDLILQYKDQFIQGAITNGCPKDEAVSLWETIEANANYGFNKSHSVAYALTGYYCQWLKVHHPLEYWTVSLQHADDKEIPSRINEINKINEEIQVAPPDINKSQEIFSSDPSTFKIYWSITKIKQVGPVAVQTIIEERNKNGQFFSLNEFYERVPKNKVNKATLLNLILAGSFDEVEGVGHISDRFDLLKTWSGLTGSDIPEEFNEENIKKEHFWVLQQRALTGLSYLQFDKLLNQTSLKHWTLTEVAEIFDEGKIGDIVILGGILQQVIQKKSKRGPFCHCIFESNSELWEATFWNETWQSLSLKYFEQHVGKIMFITGKITFDGWRNYNVIHSTNDTQIEIID